MFWPSMPGMAARWYGGICRPSRHQKRCVSTWKGRVKMLTSQEAWDDPDVTMIEDGIIVRFGGDIHTILRFLRGEKQVVLVRPACKNCNYINECFAVPLDLFVVWLGM